MNNDMKTGQDYVIIFLPGYFLERVSNLTNDSFDYYNDVTQIKLFKVDYTHEQNL